MPAQINTPEELQFALDLIIQYGDAESAVRECKARGVETPGVRALQRRFIKATEAGLKPSPAALSASGMKAPDHSPMSEDESKFRDLQSASQSWYASRQPTQIR